MNILVFGAQGSGKSTHAKYTSDKLGVPYIYTGDLFRRLEKEDSVRGKKVRDLMKKGILIPDELSRPAFEEYLRKFDISKGVVLDGYPRNLEQAASLPIKIDLIFYVVLPEEAAIKRLIERGRYDDTPEAIKERLRFYEKETKPVIDYFNQVGVKIIEIDNSPPIQVVQKKIDDLLKNAR